MDKIEDLEEEGRGLDAAGYRRLREESIRNLG